MVCRKEMSVEKGEMNCEGCVCVCVLNFVAVTRW